MNPHKIEPGKTLCAQHVHIRCWRFGVVMSVHTVEFFDTPPYSKTYAHVKWDRPVQDEPAESRELLDTLEAATFPRVPRGSPCCRVCARARAHLADAIAASVTKGRAG